MLTGKYSTRNGFLKPDLGQPALHRHLATLEAEAGPVVPGPGLLPLDAFAGLFAGPRARPAADALAVPGGAREGLSTCAVSSP